MNGSTLAICSLTSAAARLSLHAPSPDSVRPSWCSTRPPVRPQFEIDPAPASTRVGSPSATTRLRISISSSSWSSDEDGFDQRNIKAATFSLPAVAPFSLSPVALDYVRVDWPAEAGDLGTVTILGSLSLPEGRLPNSVSPVASITLGLVDQAELLSQTVNFQVPVNYQFVGLTRWLYQANPPAAGWQQAAILWTGDEYSYKSPAFNLDVQLSTTTAIAVRRCASPTSAGSPADGSAARRSPTARAPCAARGRRCRAPGCCCSRPHGSAASFYAP